MTDASTMERPDFAEPDVELPPPPGRETLYVSDAELIRRLGVPVKAARRTIQLLDANPDSGFPRKLELWGNRRYWPAVRTYLDETCGLKIVFSTRQRGRHV